MSGMVFAAYRRNLMNDKLTVSVVVPVYNGERFLAEALQSVFDQTLPPDEIIVVDDGSTDRTSAIVATLSTTAAVPMRYIYQENRGPSAARNKGLHATGADLVAFLDADDLWNLRKQEIQAAYLAANPDSLVVWGLVQMFEMHGATRASLHEPWHGPNLGSALFRRKVFDRVGVFDEGMRLSEDLDWYLRARELELPQGVLTDIVLWYRCHGENSWLGRDRAFYSSLAALKKRLERRRAV